LLAVIDAILEADRTGPVKQRHTAKRILPPGLPEMPFLNAIA
jgi:hypothetical protein